MKITTILLLLLFSLPCEAQDFFAIKDGKVSRSKIEVVTSKLVMDGKLLKEFKVESAEKPVDELVVKIIDVIPAPEGYYEPLIEFEDSQGKIVTDAFMQLEDSEDFVSVKPGKYRVIAIAVAKTTFKPKRQIEFVQVGSNPEPDNPEPDNPEPDNPEPDNPDPDNPDPDVPDDGSFKDIQQKVAELTQGMSRNAELSRVFSSVAADLKIIRNFTVQISMDQAIKKISTAMPKYLPEYTPVHEFLKMDSLTRRLGREQLIQYYEAIARGLDG